MKSVKKFSEQPVSGENVGLESGEDSPDDLDVVEAVQDMSFNTRNRRLRLNIMAADETITAEGTAERLMDSTNRRSPGRQSPGRQSPGRTSPPGRAVQHASPGKAGDLDQDSSWKAQDHADEYFERGKKVALQQQAKAGANYVMPDHKNKAAIVRDMDKKAVLYVPGVTQFSRTPSIENDDLRAAKKIDGVLAGDSQRVTKPGMRFSVIKRKGAVTGKEWAWWDSKDGVAGGGAIRFMSTPEDTDAIRAFNLFPVGPYECSILLDDRKTSVDATYLSIAPCNADKDGPAGFVMMAPPEYKWPKDANVVLPSFEKQLSRMRQEAEFVEERNKKLTLHSVVNDAEQRAQNREFESKRMEHEEKLANMMSQSRKPPITSWLGKEPPGEYAVWSIVQAGGIPPPPQKHPIVNIHTYVKKIEIGGKAGEDDGNQQMRAMLENQRVFLEVNIRTLEVWNHEFTIRYNLNLRITNKHTGEPVNPAEVEEELLVWTHTRVAKRAPPKVSRYGMQTAAPVQLEYHPATRDAPSCTYDESGKLWLFGGKTKGGQYKNYLGDVWVFDYVINLWKQLPVKEQQRKDQTAKKTMATMKSGILPGADDMSEEEMTAKRAPAAMTGRIPGPRSSAMSVVKGGFYYIAGGVSSAGKLKDVKRMDLATLVWNDLIPREHIRFNETEKLDVGTTGEHPPRGFCMRNLVLSASLYGAFLSQEAMHELCLHSLKWRLLETDGLLCWESSKILVGEEGPMLRVTSVDFAAPPAGKEPGGRYPAVESGTAWRVYANCEENEARDDPPKAWMLMEGQQVKFSSLPSIGDEPGKWAVHGISKGVVQHDIGPAVPGKARERTRTSYYIFGGVREGGTSKKSSYIDVRDEYIIGMHVFPRVGCPVVLRKFGMSLPPTVAPSTAYSDGGHSAYSDGGMSSSEGEGLGHRPISVPLTDVRPGSNVSRWNMSRSGVATSGISTANLGGSSTRGDSTRGNNAGMGRIGSNQAGLSTRGISTASSFVQTKDGKLKTGVITWIDPGALDPTAKNGLVNVLWDDEEEKRDKDEAAALATGKPTHMTQEDRAAHVSRKYSVGWQNRHDLSLYVDTSLYDVADHICNDVFELDVVESVSQMKNIKDLNACRDLHGDVEGADLLVILKDKIHTMKGSGWASGLAARKKQQQDLLTHVKVQNIKSDAEQFLSMTAGSMEADNVDDHTTANKLGYSR